MKKILAIGAHPDDIEFGCGGLLALLSSTGRRSVHLLVLCDKMADRSGRRREAEAGAERLRVSGLAFGQETDTRVEEEQVRETVERAVVALQPSEVLVHCPEDSHQDHRVVAWATMAAARRHRRVLFYETPSTLVFAPTVFVDIASSIKAKMGALRAHTSQVHRTWAGDLTLDQMAEALAVSRGIQGRMNRAEGYQPLRFEAVWDG